MKQNLTKEQLLGYLRTNKKYLNISAIAKDSGVSNLSNIIKGNVDGYGNEHKLADKHLSKLNEVVKEIRSA